MENEFHKWAQGDFADTSLTEPQISRLKKSLEEGAVINSSFQRSQYYPFPRDLCFESEKILFRKWAQDKKSLVEIGVFEGASALAFRSVMSPQGTIHLIDPFIAVPDSGLVARPWMAKLNLLRSRNGSVKWYRDTSFNIVKRWNTEIDLLFIDGDHAEISCLKDWEEWHRFVTVGGVVIFHDARFDRGNGGYWDGWPGPTNVVYNHFRGPNKLKNWEIVDEDGTVVVVRRVF